AIITQAKRTTENPDQIRRFTEASLRGIAYALKNPEEAVDILLKNNPEVDRAGAIDELTAFKRIQSTDDVLEHGLGYVNNDKMDKTIQIVTDALGLKTRVATDAVYVEGFLPENAVLLEK